MSKRPRTELEFLWDLCEEASSCATKVSRPNDVTRPVDLNSASSGSTDLSSKSSTSEKVLKSCLRTRTHTRKPSQKGVKFNESSYVITIPNNYDNERGVSDYSRTIEIVDTKLTDDFCPMKQLFASLLMHYLAIGGMSRCEELITFIRENKITIESGISFMVLFDAMKQFAQNLELRMKETSASKTIIFPEGSKCNYKIPQEALANVTHLLIVIGETKKLINMSNILV